MITPTFVNFLSNCAMQLADINNWKLYIKSNKKKYRREKRTEI